MITEETKVVLSYPIAGTQLSYGKYNYIEKTSTGDLLPERKRLRTIEPPQDAACRKQVVLSSAFVKHSLKMRPYASQNIYAYTHWKTWSDKKKLEYWIKEYIKDQDIRLSEAEYAIL